MNTGLLVLVVVVSLGSFVAAVIAFAGSGKVYDQVGKGAFELDRESEHPSGPPVDSPAARAEAAEEIRQLVEAKAARREARGQAPLDVEAEIAKLTEPGSGDWGPGTGHSEDLREEVRQLVVARNERRAARGQPPLDVEAEVERQLRDLTGE